MAKAARAATEAGVATAATPRGLSIDSHDPGCCAAVLLAIDPIGLGGIVLRARAGPHREAFLARLRATRAPATPWHRIAPSVHDSRLLGGLDLAGTLASGRPVHERGVLAGADGGLLVLAMAERLAPGRVAQITAAMDAGCVRVERDGLALAVPTRFSVIALDESASEDEAPAAALCDRVAFLVDLDLPSEVPSIDVNAALPAPAALDAARGRLTSVRSEETDIGALVTAAASLGISSPRAPLFALRAARALAAWCASATVEAAHLTLAASLVFAPRATIVPSDPPEPQPEQEEPPAAPPPESDSDTPPPQSGRLADRVVEATRALIPAQLLEQIARGVASARAPAARDRGRGEDARGRTQRGRPAGTRRGVLRADRRPNIVETLCAAAPWQRLRRAEAPGHRARIIIRSEDIRETRYVQRRPAVTIFVVDASGSSALHRLAEAKGAVELLLAQSYVRRDKVALVTVRGRAAELVLAPTRSVVRAKRMLSAVPGGGGTPLAAGIELATGLAEASRRRGESVLVVLLTDGKANVARDHRTGREPGVADAHAAARDAHARGVPSMLIDTAPRASEASAALATTLGARYLALPYADARVLASAVQAFAGNRDD